MALNQFDAGAGLSSLSVATTTPSQLFSVHLGPGCALDTPPTLFAGGTPPRAEIGNSSFALVSSGNAPFQPNHLRFGFQPGTVMIQSCQLLIGPSAAATFVASIVTSDAAGVATHPAPVPSDVSLEGLDVRLQALGRDPGNGALFANFELSDGLLVRVGSAISSCP